MTPLGAVVLFLAGVAASVFGSLVGLGGGFVVLPILRLAYGVPPAQAAGTSLLMVFANTAAATIGYLRDRKIDLRLAIPFALGGVPGSIAGVLAVRRFSPTGFDIAYSCVMITLAVLVLRQRGATHRAQGERTWAHDPRVGAIGGFAVGFFSSLFGIGGGVVMIPLLLIAARMPPHVVVATGAFVVTTTAPVGIAAHAYAGHVDWIFAAPLVLGGLAGGSIGPMIARRVSSPRLVTLLSIALAIAASSLAVRHFL
jgi:uncharacterized membrane protein YfcA